MAERVNIPCCPESSSSQTVVLEEVDSARNQTAGTPPTLRLKCRKPKSDKSVRWNEGTVDNENMNKKKSKCCCIYKKPKQRFDESSESESDECENCFGHVEVKQAKKLAKASCSDQSASTSSSDVPVEHSPQPINPSGMTTVSS
ncbi:E3 ubiquitin-protein ligase PPP1R11-like [Planococcus citri]|uniref:E3 ubiquitin-protein ligase PPP1R11-like n=1 Tax=Planococcus citri TaxID=170843 RepID=UPI0031F9614C